MPVRFRQGLPLLAFLAVGCGGGGGRSASPNPQSESVALQWNSTLLDAVSEVKTGPTVTSRALAIVQTAVYDAWAQYDVRAAGVHLGTRYRRPPGERTLENQSAAVSYAAFRTLVDLFPTERARFEAKMAALGLNPADESLSTATPAGIGNLAAQAVLQYRHADGANQLGGYADTSGYAPVNTVDQVNDPSRWQPLRFVMPDGTVRVPGFLTPHWGGVKTFAVDSVTAMRPSEPPRYGSPEFERQMEEIIQLTANLNDRQKCVAEYWADGPASVTPPGHWHRFGEFVSRRDRYDLERDVKLFFLLGNAVLDAGICCWDAKRTYDTCRPISAIRQRYAGQTIPSWGGPGRGTVQVDASQWQPFQPASFITPPFAEYTSGHSTFSAASAEVLRRFTGSDRFGGSYTMAAGASLTDGGHGPAAAVTLSWPTFSSAAEEAGMSRRWGGIHFESGDLTARQMGRQVGERVWEKATRLFRGETVAP